jgi:exosortase/archaeosortase family protein
MPALAEGNTIQLDDVQINIVEACSGLSMLIVFFALSTGTALVVRRPLWEKGLILFSAIPIALVANIMRITITGVLFRLVSDKVADAFFHDAAGWLMMPLALALLGGELWLLGKLLIDPAKGGPIKAQQQAKAVTLQFGRRLLALPPRRLSRHEFVREPSCLREV